jgi:hypothetical protein
MYWQYYFLTIAYCTLYNYHCNSNSNSNNNIIQINDSPPFVRNTSNDTDIIHNPINLYLQY